MIDTKRLATNAAYWDEVAPHWATAYGVAGNQRVPVWFNLKQYVHVGSEKAFQYGSGICFDLAAINLLVNKPRPTKPAAPDWDGEGLPPVGCECEYKCNGVWGAVKVNAIGKHHILIEHLGVEVCRRIEDLDFRPIRTKEQMERDELIEIILTDGDLSAGMLADVILSRYNLEPKP